ncbi:MAG: hypothetical protein AAFV25_03780 [Bacteroidota bacterium]
MKTTWRFTTLALVVTVLMAACGKEEMQPGPTTGNGPVVVDSTAIIEAREQNDADQYAIAQTLLNEVVTLPFRLAYQNSELFGAVGSTKAQSRSGCPMDTVLMDQGTGDTLLIDFGNGCTVPNGPTIAGEIMLISFGSFLSNANQFIWFDTLTVNGYQVIHLPGQGSSGLKFNNVGGLAYLFEGLLPNNTFFEIRNPNGDATRIVPQYSSDLWCRIKIVDNNPPLVLEYDDFIDARFEIELNRLTVNTFRTDGSIDTYFVQKVFDTGGIDEVIYEPVCRWFIDGQLQFTGMIEQTLDFGYDLDENHLPVLGVACDGVVKITTPSGDCRVVICP